MMVRPSAGAGKRRVAGTDAQRLAMKPVQGPDAAHRHITLICSGATVTGAAVIPPHRLFGQVG
jgi:hypothetical protein